MKIKGVLFIITYLIFSLNILFAQDPTIDITPTTLNLGNIEILTSTDETHSFDVVIGAAGASTIYVQAYIDDGTWSGSPSFEISVDGKSTWGNNKSFVPNTAGETRTIYVRCSPIANNTDNSQSEIYVFAASNYDYIDQAYVTLVFPEMDMYGGSAISPIADGDAIPSTSDSTDFGNVAINATSKVTYTIQNNKFGPSFVLKGRLFLVDIGTNEYITIGGTDASMFTVATQPTVPIAYSGGSTTFKIAFTPTSSGTKSATISIGNNDQTENPYNFSIQGTGTASVPTVTTSSITSITSSTASGGGNVTSNGGASVTARGVCWNTSTDPTTSNSYTTNGAGTGSFASSLTSLVDETHYYVRAYASNSAGDGYGSNVEFWTLSTEPSTQASSVTTTATSGSTIDLSWNGATGAYGYIILQKEGSSAPTATGVVDGIIYSSFTGLPTGTTVAAEVTGTTRQITGLSASTQYSFAIIPYAIGADPATYNYKTDGTLATKTESTVADAPTTQASGIKWGTTGPNQMEISWIAGNGSGQILLMKASGAASNPINGTTYTGSTTFGSGTQIGAGTYVIYQGSGAKGRVFVDNLTAGIIYHFKVLEYAGSGSQTSYNIDEIANFGVGNSEATALPIELISFTAQIQENGEVMLNWTTASETNNDFFTIEKSYDLNSWDNFSNIKGAGNSSTENNYSLIDNNPYDGLSYYRLKQTDFDGVFSYSDIIFVDKEKNEKSIVFEQPYKSGSSLQTILYNQSGKTLNVEIINLLGQAIYREEIKPQSDIHIITLNVDKFDKGIYLLKITNQNDFLVKKFLNN
ncbi:MAG: choice-of-anchor D domain-containing protein [Saprospiraceae bacterium]|nr:choice-of-anchor D domain-containing protein [Saprospiraceae bacterium]